MFCEELLQQNELWKFSCETRFDYNGRYDRAKFTSLGVFDIFEDCDNPGNVG